MVEAANGRRDIVRCGSGRDRVSADREDRLIGCERRRVLPSPAARGIAPGRQALLMFLVRFRAVEEVTGGDELFSIEVEGPAREVRRGSRPPRRACVTVAAPWSGTALLPFGGDGERAKRWCRGVYRGSVSFERVASPAAAGRPMHHHLPCGRFSFRVR